MFGTATISLEDLYRLAEENGITVDHIHFDGKAMTIEYEGEYFIAIRISISESLEFICLAHELSHCLFSGFYTKKTPKSTIEKIEARTNKWMYITLLPIEYVREMFAKGLSYAWEFAEETGLPEKFVADALKYYSDRGLLMPNYGSED